MYAYVCGRDEPFSYLIPFYSSSCIVLLVIARTAQCFRFRYTVTFELSVYLASLRCVSTTRQEKHGVVRRWRNRAKLTSKESQEKNESMPFFSFSYLSTCLSFYKIRASIEIATFSFREDQKRPSERSWRGRAKGKAIRARWKEGREGWRQHRSRPPDCDKTRIEFYSQPRNSIRDEVVATNEIHSFAPRVSFPFRFPPRFIDARDSRETDHSFDHSFFFFLLLN